MEKPVFETEAEAPIVPAKPSAGEAAILSQIAAGTYDDLFSSGPGSEQLSALYLSTQHAIVVKPSVRLKSAIPDAPLNIIELNYPPLALRTRTEGEVTVTFEILPDGSTQDAQILSGHKLLNQSVLDAVSSWKFPAAEQRKAAQAMFEFRVNCRKKD
jgi:TonB family protein